MGISSVLGAQITHEADKAVLLGVLGGISAVIPDLDVIFALTEEKAHRSPLSHSFGSSLVITAAMMIVCVAVAESSEFIFADWMLAPIFAALFLSAFSHPATDSLTRAGTSLLWPISSRRYRGTLKYNDLVANSSLSILGLVLMIAAAVSI